MTTSPQPLTGDEALLTKYARIIVERFEKDEQQGYHSSTRTYVLDMLRPVLAARPTADIGDADEVVKRLGTIADGKTLDVTYGQPPFTALNAFKSDLRVILHFVHALQAENAKLRRR